MKRKSPRIDVRCNDGATRQFNRMYTSSQQLAYSMCGHVTINGKRVDGYAILELGNCTDTMPVYVFHPLPTRVQNDARRLIQEDV